MTGDPKHREMRELLGSYALGALPVPEAAAVRAHLEGCPACQWELADIAPLAVELQRADPARLSTIATPPAWLGGRVREAVAQERSLGDRRHNRQALGRRAVAAAAAVVLLGAGAGLGEALFRSGLAGPSQARPSVNDVPGGAPTTTTPTAAGAFLPVVLGDEAPGITVRKAGVVPHSWGVELKFEGAGFATGQTYRAYVVSTSGLTLPAGEFLGIGGQTLQCNLQAAILRPDVSAFRVVATDGSLVLTATL